MNTATDNMILKSPKTSGGVDLGQSSSDLIGFYGTTPIARSSDASQATVSSVVNLTGGTGNWSSGLAESTATFSSAVINSGFATLAQAVNNQRTLIHAIRSALTSLGIIQGGT